MLGMMNLSASPLDPYLNLRDTLVASCDGERHTCTTMHGTNNICTT